MQLKNSILLWFALCSLLCSGVWPSEAGRTSSAHRMHRSRKHVEGEPLRCEAIEIPQCRDIGYNHTDMALSPANMVKQSDAAPVVKEFVLLFESACAEEMKLLVCSVYTPICLSKYSKFLPPCRHICTKAKKGCGPILAQYEIEWPDLLQCENYPVYSGNNQLCLHFNRTGFGAVKKFTEISRNLEANSLPSWSSFGVTDKSRSNNSQEKSMNSDDVKCYCRPPMVQIYDRLDPLFNKVATGSVRNCAFPCASPYYSINEFAFIQTWITGWSVLCFLVTLATVSTFLIDTGRFTYPERPIIFLSVCHMFVSLGFLIRVVAGHEAVACGWGTDRVLYHVSGPLLCSTSFLLLYFFGMASNFWWVMLTLTWLLAAGLKWSNEAIEKSATYFHIISWFIPALQSVMVLVTSSIDGDALSGVCFVGNQDLVNLNCFLFGPLIVCLSLGGFFLLLGFINLFRIRTTIKKVGNPTQRLDKLMGRIGFFSLIYMALTITLLVCQYYEHLNQNKWATLYNCNQFSSPPQIKVMMIKYSVTMLPGVAIGVWICSRKTFYSWMRFCGQSSSCAPSGLVVWLKQRRMKCQQSDAEASWRQSSKISPNLSANEERNSLITSHCSSETSSRDDSLTHTDPSATYDSKF